MRIRQHESWKGVMFKGSGAGKVGLFEAWNTVIISTTIPDNSVYFIILRQLVQDTSEILALFAIFVCS